jgi:enamine deaminase RidA (YjgF/YER057c/UK114 family)
VEIKRSPVIVAGQTGGYAKGCVVTGAKGFVLLSGSVGIDTNTGEIPTSAGEQTKLAMKNIKARLEEYGTSLNSILFTRIYVKGDFPNGIVNDPKYQEASAAMQEFWREHCPEFLQENNPSANTLLGVTSLARPDFFIEIEVEAAIQ